MTESFRSAVELRHDFCNTTADLQQRYTAPLPDGATVFIPATGALYRLFKGLGTTFDTITGLVVIPANDSSDRWVLQEVEGTSPWAGQEASQSINNIPAPGSDVWAALGTLSGSFALAAGNANVFQVNATSSLLTYHGVPRSMKLLAIASMLGAAADIFSIVISKNDDVPAGSSSPQYLKGEQSASNAATSRVNITTQRIVTLEPGDTLRLMARSFAGDQVIQFHQATLSVVPA